MLSFCKSPAVCLSMYLLRKKHKNLSVHPSIDWNMKIVLSLTIIFATVPPPLYSWLGLWKVQFVVNVKFPRVHSSFLFISHFRHKLSHNLIKGALKGRLQSVSPNIKLKLKIKRSQVWNEKPHKEFMCKMLRSLVSLLEVMFIVYLPSHDKRNIKIHFYFLSFQI